MEFLFPNMLWGLLLLAIPIIVHLFNLRRAKKVQFSNVRFLSVIKSTSSSKLVLKHYLALLFRSLFILFLVVAFSVPYLSRDENEYVENRTNIIYLDNSYSNSNLYNAALSGFERNFSLISSMVGESGNAQRYRLYTNESADISNRTPLVKEKFLEKLSEVQLTSLNFGLGQLSNKIRRYNDQNTVYVFSDFQREQYSFTELADTTNQYVLVPSKYNIERNVFVDTLFLDNISIRSDSRNTLNVVFRNSGHEDVDDLSVNLIANDTQLSTNTVDIKANKSISLEIDIGSVRDSIVLCEINFEDFPMTFDNRFFFVIKRTRPITVLDIGSGPKNVFSSLFESELFDYQLMPESNIDYSLLQLSDLVITNEIKLEDPSLVRELKLFLDKGGAVLIVPTEGINISSVEQITNANIDLFEQTVLNVEQPNITDPFFKDIFDADPDDAKMPASKSLITWNSGRPLMKFSNGKPYLSSFDVGEGNVFILAGDLSSSGNNFTQNALFLPVMYNIGFESSNKSPFKIYDRISEDFVSVDIESESPSNLYKLRNGDLEIIPEQRVIDGQLLINVGSLDVAPGFWELTTDNQVVDVLALNHSSEESVVDQYSIQEIEEFSSKYSNVTVLSLNDNQNWGESGGVATDKKNLWKYSLILALLFFFAEVLTLRFL